LRYRDTKVNHYTWRYRIVLFLLLMAALALVYRMFNLMVFDRQFLVNQGDARMMRVMQTQAYRGMITDRFGNPLAISAPVEAAWADPETLLDLPQTQLKSLASALGISLQTLKTRIGKKKLDFVYLQRQLTPTQADKVRELKIKGVFLKREYKRYYPDGEVSAQVVGINNIDDKGQEGIELKYDAQLEGVPGAKRVLKDRLGYIVSEVDELSEPKAGENVTLSLDNRIQYLAYRALKDGVQQYKAKAGTAIVIDIHTGEILAMVNAPSFNPNNRPDVRDGRFKNHAVTDTFEPGSTIKAFTVAMGLTSGEFTPETILETAPGWMKLGKNIVRDEHNKENMTVSKALKISSNMGMARIILALPLDSFRNYLATFGLGKATGSGFPGEVSGSLPSGSTRFSEFTAATLSFGYGLTVTPLQLAHMYATLANNGVQIPMTFLKTETTPQGEQIIDPTVAHEVIEMLQTVVEPGGTATRARVPGYWIAGKTGTTRIVGRGGYQNNHHNAFFVGIAPATNPQIVVLVFLNDPQGKLYMGGETAAPIFSKIMGGALRILNISPDHLEEKS
jgi:cell division protein FtsI (penicillin-binding protein 3)